MKILSCSCIGLRHGQSVKDSDSDRGVSLPIKNHGKGVMPE